MAPKNVVEYWASWNCKVSSGELQIKTDDNFVKSVILNASDFAAMLDLLRNEKPLRWDSATMRLSTFNEPPGEGES